jgi:uncharacterized protein (DUF488 family)
MEFFTIGVFNSTEKKFFDTLVNNNIDTFCDIRQRRGVRGAKYAYVNSTKLQQKLEELNITYLYIQDLAPTSEIRELQKKADKENRELKTERLQLGHIFVSEYKSRIIEHFNFENFMKKLGQQEAKKIALFCVEEHAEACHRSIVAKKISTDLDLQVIDL